MKTKRFDFNFKPLQINIAMSVDGSVPGKQNYNADADEYTPDYTVTPCIIFPRVSQIDKDEIFAAGSVNHALANVKWYEIVSGVRTEIQDANTNYEIVRSGGLAGRIKVKKNAQPQLPITLEFNADYTDTRTNQIIAVKETYMIVCNNSTTFIPNLLLDAADQTIYNPLRDTATQTVHASLRVGDEECPAANRQFVWELFREDNTWSAIGSDNVLDYPVTVANDGASVTIDRSLMGQELYLRCRAKYSPDGTPASVALTAASPSKIVAFIRRMPKFEYDIMDLPTNIPAGLLAVAPQAKIWDTVGLISNPDRELLAKWFLATNRASGSLTYQQVGHGLAPTLKTSLMSDTYGGVYGLDVVDAGPTACWEDSDGAVFEDSDGILLLVK